MTNNIYILKTIDEEIINKLVSIYFSAFNKFNFRNWGPQDFIDLINNRSSIFYTLSKNKIIGFAAVRFNEEFSEIITIAVKNQYQRKKIGKNLLHYIMSNSDFEGNFVLDVAVINTNAIKFYKKFGFKKIAQRKNYYLICNGDNAGQRIDAVVMQFLLR